MIEPVYLQCIELWSYPIAALIKLEWKKNTGKNMLIGTWHISWCMHCTYSCTLLNIILILSVFRKLEFPRSFFEVI